MVPSSCWAKIMTFSLLSRPPYSNHDSFLTIFSLLLDQLDTLDLFWNDSIRLIEFKSITIQRNEKSLLIFLPNTYLPFHYLTKPLKLLIPLFKRPRSTSKIPTYQLQTPPQSRYSYILLLYESKQDNSAQSVIGWYSYVCNIDLATLHHFHGRR